MELSQNKSAPHSFVKDGVDYFVRCVPKDLQHHYTSPKISFSLRTRSASVATSRALRDAQRLDEHWFSAGSTIATCRGSTCWFGAKHQRCLQYGSLVCCWSRHSEALACRRIYLRLKGEDRPTHSIDQLSAAAAACGALETIDRR